VGGRTLRVLGAALLLAAVAAPPASAHGLASPPGVRVPGYLFAWGAAAVLVLSFVALGTLWKTPRLEGTEPHRVAMVPRAVEALCGGLGVAIFAILVYAGLAGTRESADNLTPTVVYVLFWVGLVPVSALLGNVWQLFNPWRAVARAIGVVARRRAGVPLPYPPGLGRWPAVAGIAAFAWLELAYVHKADPLRLAILMLAYAAVQLVGIAFFGVRQWTTRGDAFSAYFGMFARLAPVDFRGREVLRRPVLSGAPALAAVPGTVALLCVMLGSTGYDGLSSTSQWGELAPKLQHDFTRLGLGGTPAQELTSTLGLIAMTALVAGVYTLGIRGIRSAGATATVPELRRRFVHTLIPISLAYVLAHYFAFLVYQGQGIAPLISDPLGHGSNLFGTAHATIDYHLLSKASVWYVQVAALVCGHVLGIVLSHDRALARFPRRELASQSQYWMLTVMVGYTGLGLWLLATIRR